MAESLPGGASKSKGRSGQKVRVWQAEQLGGTCNSDQNVVGSAIERRISLLEGHIKAALHSAHSALGELKNIRENLNS